MASFLLRRRRNLGSRIVWWLLGVTGLGSFLGTVLLIVLAFVIVFSMVVAVLPTDGDRRFSTSSQIILDLPQEVKYVWTGPKNGQVVEAAMLIAGYLHSCGEHKYKQCYGSDMPALVTNYWASSCGGGCEQYWRSGSLQCVLFVYAAYGLARQPLPVARNAVLFWQDYARLPDWERIPYGSALPWPGDMIVWSAGDSPGHIAVVVDVKAPTNKEDGYVQFAQANSFNAIDTQRLDRNLHIWTWDSFNVLGYIRHRSAF